MFEHMLPDIPGRSSTKWEAIQTVANGQGPTSKVFTSLAKAVFCLITNQCNAVLSVRQIAVIGFKDLVCVA
jgi:hypothetical protein